jgi:hypothetical protein
MRLLYPSTAAYATVMADVASFTGACTIALMLVSKVIFQVRNTFTIMLNNTNPN